MLGRRQTGLSLVELALGLAIMSIVVAMATPSYIAWIANSRVRNVAEGLLGGLQLARAEAVSRNAQVQLSVDADLGWTVGCVSVSAGCPASISMRSGADNPPNVTLILTLADTTTSAGPILSKNSGLTAAKSDQACTLILNHRRAIGQTEPRPLGSDPPNQDRSFTVPAPMSP